MEHKSTSLYNDDIVAPGVLSWKVKTVHRQPRKIPTSIPQSLTCAGKALQIARVKRGLSLLGVDISRLRGSSVGQII